MVEFKLPDVGEGMHEAEIVRWLVKPGQSVKLDEPMLEIQTDKALVEIPSPVAGKVVELKVAEGKIAQLGEVLIVLEPQGAKATPSTTAPVASQPAPALAAIAAPMAQAINGNGSSGPPRPVRAAPAVRKFALEQGIDLALIKPSSPDGRVLLEDVKAFMQSQGKNGSNGVAHTAVELPVAVAGTDLPAPVETAAEAVKAAPPKAAAVAGTEERRPLTGLRRRIAERMELAWRTIPHVTSFDELDATGLIALRQQLKAAAEKRGLSFTYLPIIMKATLIALKEYPNFNASLDEASREVVYKHYYHIGMATSTPEGLLVPVLREANQKSMLELAGEISRLGEGARKRSLAPAELSGSTFTITNFGSYGEAVGTPIINPPEVAILGVGRIQEKVVAYQGQPAVRPRLPFCLSFDHRVIDGADSGAFMARIKELLEDPTLLLLAC